MELLLSKYYFAPFLLLSFRFFSHSLYFLFLICFQIQGCEKAAKDNVLKHRVMWLQAAFVFSLHFSNRIHKWLFSFFLCLSVFHCTNSPTVHAARLTSH